MRNIITDFAQNALERRRERQTHQDITRSLDALALTELGYPPKAADPQQRRWFLYL